MSSEPEMKVAEFMTLRGGIGNDAFAGAANLINVARAMFANEGIDLKTVESFRCRVTRNHDADDIGGYPIAMWDTWVEVEFPAPADEAKE
jgi:hydroxymethylglutaryl-CoA reductase